jgi:phage terminase small subunit
MSKGRNLTTKQRLFVEAYLANPNATEAARRAGYKGNDVTLGAVGGENLRKPLIAALISERVEKAVMSADEVLQRLTEHATASLADLLDDAGHFDLEKAKREGKDHLMKKLKVRRNITTSSTNTKCMTLKPRRFTLERFTNCLQTRPRSRVRTAIRLSRKYVVEVVSDSSDSRKKEYKQVRFTPCLQAQRSVFDRFAGALVQVKPTTLVSIG